MNDTNKQGFALLLFVILLALVLPIRRETIVPLIVGMVALILAGWPRRA